MIISSSCSYWCQKKKKKKKNELEGTNHFVSSDQSVSMIIGPNDENIRVFS